MHASTRCCSSPSTGAGEAAGPASSTVVGWAGYVVTSYQIQGSKNNKLFGYFVSVTWEGIVSETGGNPNFGAHGVTLVE
jgi:hypothetical protein